MPFQSAGAQAKDAVVHGILIGSEYVVDKAGVAKDTTLEKGQQVYGATKDTLLSAGQTTAQSARSAKMQQAMLGRKVSRQKTRLLEQERMK